MNPTPDLQTELRRTEPDFVVYVPRSADGSTHDTGNEHFLVFDGPDGSLMAVWTQSTREGRADQRIVFSRSEDEGATWAPPRTLAGPPPGSEGGLASWGFPMVARSGRIYVVFNQHVGRFDTFFHTTGRMAGLYSDDAGRTWSEPAVVPMPRSPYDNPDPAYPSNWIVWQKPERLSHGRHFAGFTRWVSSAVRHPPPMDCWFAKESVVEFMRFENLDEDPEPRELEVAYFCGGDAALRVGFPGHPEVSVAQEPSLAPLPDGRLFASLRTATGHPYYTVSDDAGETWRPPEVLRQHDGGPPFLHPCSPCPMYPLGDGRYVFLHHGHDGHFRQWGPTDTQFHRRPILTAVGTFRPDDRQPVAFGPARFLMDHTGVPLGADGGRCDLAMYASVTRRGGRTVLWYPDRKFFLLGRVLSDEVLGATA
jgi:hypothetical protein